jgi:hypothetical protein
MGLRGRPTGKSLAGPRCRARLDQCLCAAALFLNCGSFRQSQLMGASASHLIQLRVLVWGLQAMQTGPTIWDYYGLAPALLQCSTGQWRSQYLHCSDTGAGSR